MPFALKRPTEKATEQAMLDPQPGDVFSEMYSFWVYVAHRDGDTVVTIETPPLPCTLPEDGRWRTYTLKEFRQRFGYDTMPNYWVQLYKRGDPHPVQWYQAYRASKSVCRVIQGL